MSLENHRPAVELFLQSVFHGVPVENLSPVIAEMIEQEAALVIRTQTLIDQVQKKEFEMYQAQE